LQRVFTYYIILWIFQWIFDFFVSALALCKARAFGERPPASFERCEKLNKRSACGRGLER